MIEVGGWVIAAHDEGGGTWAIACGGPLDQMIVELCAGGSSLANLAPDRLVPIEELEGEVSEWFDAAASFDGGRGVVGVWIRRGLALGGDELRALAAIVAGAWSPARACVSCLATDPGVGWTWPRPGGADSGVAAAEPPVTMSTVASLLDALCEIARDEEALLVGLAKNLHDAGFGELPIGRSFVPPEASWERRWCALQAMARAARAGEGRTLSITAAPSASRER